MPRWIYIVQKQKAEKNNPSFKNNVLKFEFANLDMQWSLTEPRESCRELSLVKQSIFYSA